MSDDSDDPVMALLATQRAVLAAVENLASQVEAMHGKVDIMSGVLARLVATDTAEAAPVAKGGADRPMTLGDRFRAATPDEAARDPELRHAQAFMEGAEAIARKKWSDMATIEKAVMLARTEVAVMLDDGRPIPVLQVRETARDRER